MGATISIVFQVLRPRPRKLGLGEYRTGLFYISMVQPYGGWCRGVAWLYFCRLINWITDPYIADY